MKKNPNSSVIKIPRFQDTFKLLTCLALLLNINCTHKSMHQQLSYENTPSLSNNRLTPPSKSDTLTHKIVPKAIRPQVTTALSFYPGLKKVPIEFKFKDNIKKSTMQAQPKLSGLFKARKNRKYVVLINKKIQIENDDFNILDVDDKVLTGWFGHELGHIMDYRTRSAASMVLFGIKYLFSKSFLKKAERTADRYAIEQGMGDYILATKNFILNNSKISSNYKARIKALYLSPEEIMDMINSMKDGDDVTEKVDQEVNQGMED